MTEAPGTPPAQLHALQNPTGPARIVPVVHRGVVLLGGAAGPVPPELRIDGAPDAGAVAGADALFLSRVPVADFRLDLRRDGASLPGLPLAVQVGGWEGVVEWSHAGLVAGRARSLRDPGRDVAVVAFDAAGPVAFATARAAEEGAFLLRLPAALVEGPPRRLRLGIVGSDFLFAGADIEVGSAAALPRAVVVLPQPLRIRIKISCPNLKEAPAWGDYAFARSLQAAFERLGIEAATDTLDSWYDRAAQEDVVIALRGRQRLTLDPAKINIMWLISHPDRISAEEFADYDHIAVASDLYARRLQAQGLPSVSVLHQATDAGVFGAADLAARVAAAAELAGAGEGEGEGEGGAEGLRADGRKPACLFVGNSRREYRSMVKWCLQAGIPLELYGGGWEGVLDPALVRAENIPNALLPEYYAGHLVVLNDHWDSMRDNGFLSNRLFDASATGTPIITDPVMGLSEVFADTIPVARDAEELAALVQDCLADPEAWLARAARARDLVLGHHSFDHRAGSLQALIGVLAQRKAVPA